MTVAMPLKKRKARCTAVGKPENAMKRRKALLSEEELLVTKERDKVCKASKRVSETCEQSLHGQEQNRTHLACAKGSALQCCSFHLFIFISCFTCLSSFPTCYTVNLVIHSYSAGKLTIRMIHVHNVM